MDYDTEYFPYFFQTIHILIYLKDKNNTIYQNNKNLFDIIIHCQTYSERYELFLSNIKIFKTLGYDFWRLVIKKFAIDLNRIIMSSPRTTKCIILWRGSKSDYLKKLTLDTSSNTKQLVHNGFVSCSFDIQSVREFMNKKNSCCLMRITIPINSNCLFVPCVSRYHAEGEILLSNNALFLFLTPLYREIYIPDDEASTNQFKILCENKNKINASFLRFNGYLK